MTGIEFTFIYNRIERSENEAKETYVRKDICAVHQEYLHKELKPMNKKLDDLLNKSG